MAGRYFEPDGPSVCTSSLEESIQGTLGVGLILNMEDAAHKGLARWLRQNHLHPEQLTKNVLFFALDPIDEAGTKFRLPQGTPQLPGGKDLVLMRSAEYRTPNASKTEDLKAVVIAKQDGKPALTCPRRGEELAHSGKSGLFMRREDFLSVQVGMENGKPMARVYLHRLKMEKQRTGHNMPTKVTYEVECSLQAVFTAQEAVEAETWDENNFHMREAVLQGFRKFRCKGYDAKGAERTGSCADLHYAQKTKLLTELCKGADVELPNEESVTKPTRTTVAEPQRQAVAEVA